MSSTLAAQSAVSRTAYDCAAVRAVVFEWTKCQSFDYLAAEMVRGPSVSARARLGVALAKLGAHGLTRRIASRTSPGVEVFLFARSAVPDDLARAALDGSADTQVVILGAGLDTSALRIGAERVARGQTPGHFFEVDLPQTQAEKRSHVDRLLTLRPDLRQQHIRYVPCSFGQEELSKVLVAAGFDATRPTVWVWSGVIHYLPEDAVRSTLAELKKLSGAGSKLFFDFIALEAYAEPATYGFAKSKARFDAFGEVMAFGFREGTEHVRQWLGEQGLTLVKVLNHKDMVAVYEDHTKTKAFSSGAPWANLCIAAF